MAQRRMINKDDVESMSFGELTIRQRYLYWAITLYADDDGIIPVKFVKSRAFPCDDDISEEDVYVDLIKLEKLDFVKLYEEHKYLIVSGWWTRQKIRKSLYKETKHKKPSGYLSRSNEEDELRNHCAKSAHKNREDSLDQLISGREIQYVHSDGIKRDYPEYPLDPYPIT